MYGAFFICMLASPMKEIWTNLKIGWKRTLVTGARWPLRQNFSGGLGIHSLGVLLSLVGAPDIYSFSASANFASSSLTCNPKVLIDIYCVFKLSANSRYLFYSNMWHYYLPFFVTELRMSISFLKVQRISYRPHLAYQFLCWMLPRPKEVFTI